MPDPDRLMNYKIRKNTEIELTLLLWYQYLFRLKIS